MEIAYNSCYLFHPIHHNKNLLIKNYNCIYNTATIFSTEASSFWNDSLFVKLFKLGLWCFCFLYIPNMTGHYEQADLTQLEQIAN